MLTDCFFLGRNLSAKNPSRKQIVAEKLVSMLSGLIRETMGKHNMMFLPYIGALFSYSMLSSLLGLVGLRAPTGDLNTTIGFALIAFFLIQFFNIKNRGFFGWLKGFTEPVFLLTPLNIVISSFWKHCVRYSYHIAYLLCTCFSKPCSFGMDSRNRFHSVFTGRNSCILINLF